MSLCRLLVPALVVLAAGMSDGLAADATAVLKQYPAAVPSGGTAPVVIAYQGVPEDGMLCVDLYGPAPGDTWKRQLRRIIREIGGSGTIKRELDVPVLPEGQYRWQVRILDTDGGQRAKTLSPFLPVAMGKTETNRKQSPTFPTRIQDYTLRKGNIIAFRVSKDFTEPIVLKSLDESQFSLVYTVVGPDGGEIIGDTIFPGQEVRLDVADRPEGLYILDCFSWGGVYQIRFGAERPWAWVRTVLATDYFVGMRKPVDAEFHFYVPPGQEAMTVTLANLDGGTVTLIAPSGRTEAKETVSEGTYRLHLKVPRIAEADRGRVWTLRLEDLYYKGLLAEVDGDMIYSLDPAHTMFIVEKIEANRKPSNP